MKLRSLIPRRPITCIMVTVFFLINQTILSAQQYKLETIPSINTLSANSVYAILRDKEGFLWIGTQNGLNRYDGRQYKYFIHNDKDSSSLSDNFVVALSEDSLGNIWIGTRHGLNKFDKRSQTFQRFYLMDLAKNPSHQTVYSLVCSPDGRMFAAAGGHLYTISPAEHNKILRYRTDDSVMSVTYDFQNALVIGKLGLIEIRPSQGETIFYDVHSEIKINNLISTQRSLFLATQSGFWIIDLEEHRLGKERNWKHFLNGISVFTLSKDAHQRIWIGTDNGIYIYDGGEHILQIKEKSLPSGWPEALNCRSLMSDQTGTIWIGLLRNGILQYDPSKEQFRSIDKTALGKDGVVWSILQDKTTTYWVGTQRGVFQFDMKGLQFEKLRPYNQKMFRNTMIGELMEDSHGNIWMGSKPDGLFRYSPKEKLIKHFRHADHDHFSLVHNNVSSLWESNNGKIWITTSSGLCFFDPKKEIFTRVTLVDSLHSAEVTYLLHVREAANHLVWIATSSGLFCLNQSNGKQTFYRSVVDDSTTLSNNIVASTMEDRQGRMWVATLGGGINLFDKKRGRFIRFNTSDGLVNDVVYGILEDSYGRLWMSTDYGLSCFDPESKKFSTYGKEEGLNFLEFSQNSFYKNSSGTMFFGGVGGVVIFQPESIKSAVQQDLIVVSDIRINYESIAPDNSAIVKGTITTPQEIHLTNDQKALSIDFASLNFRLQDKTSYAYRLKGFYDPWVFPSDHQRTAHYTHLSPGEYLFQVKASTQKGEWGEKELRIRIIVYPPFWRTWWFMLLSSACAFGIIVFTVRYVSQRTLKIRLREIEMQQKVNAERERISRDLHDSTGSNIAGIISGLNLAERYLETSKQKTKSTLQSLTKEARASMTQLRETILALKTDEMSVDEFADSVNEMIAKQLLFRKNIKFHLLRDFPQGLMLSSIQGLHLTRIIEEAVTNALHHSTAKNITVRIGKREGRLSIQLHNDGKKKKQRNNPLFHGNGIPNMERRANEIGATFSFDSDEQKGSSITVLLSTR